MNKNEIIKMLNLEPLPGEGGYYRQSYIDKCSTAIYFLVGGKDYSAIHRLKTPEIYHWYGGAPLDIFTLSPEGKAETHVLGIDLIKGQQPQCVVPGHYWQGSRSQGDWTLLGTTMAPGYNHDEFELGDKKLLQEYPECRAYIERFLP